MTSDVSADGTPLDESGVPLAAAVRNVTKS